MRVPKTQVALIYTVFDLASFLTALNHRQLCRIEDRVKKHKYGLTEDYQTLAVTRASSLLLKRTRIFKYVLDHKHRFTSQPQSRQA